MQEQVKATFLVNAAVLLEFRGTKLLIDGIYDENGHCFSNLSERQWEKLKAGEGEFAGIEYLLFTHEHGDHFSPQRVAEYLEYRQPKAIFMPRDGSAALRALQKKAEGMGIPCVLLHRELCRKTVFRPEQEIRIRAFQTRHLDKLYWDVPHFCYLLECGEKKLLFTADVDFTQAGFFHGAWHGAGCGVCQSADEPQRGGQGIICSRRIADKNEDCLSYSLCRRG